jgi:hypothetical protein
MLFVVKVDTDAVEDPRVVAHIARGFLRGIVAQNRVLLRSARLRGKPYPELYKSGVVFGKEAKPKPGRPRVQQMVDLRTVLRRGWGDCKHLSAWRVAELQEAGDLRADIKIYWRCYCTRCDRALRGMRCTRCGARPKPHIFHAEVRRGDGSVEDVSRYLGM